MVGADRTQPHGKLRRSAARQLIRVDAKPQAGPTGGGQHRCRVLQREEALVAEHVTELRGPGGGDRGDHLVGDEARVVSG